jgi:hypothetical protein
MARRTVAARRTAPEAGSSTRPMPRMPPQTAPVAFRAIPAEGRHLLTVAAGVECETARREAADLEDAVRRLLAGSVECGADGSTAYLCEFALETARALRDATTEG